MKYSFFTGFIFVFLFSSCEKEELPVSAHDAGTTLTATVNMNADYRYQIYFDLETNTVVGQVPKTSWDLGFETRANGNKVIVNSAKAMYAFNTGDTSFVSLTDTSGFAAGKMWDAVSGNLDSTAIGNWTTTHNTFILDRGYSETGQHQGFRKVRFENVNASEYTVRFANMNGSSEVLITVPKDSAYNFTFLSFSNGGQIVTVEPPKRDWDLVFTQYIHVFYNPTEPYLVTGCLLNRFNTEAILDSTVNYADIDFTSASSYALSPLINVIGYDWKAWNGTAYITFPEMNYVILDQHGYYYKLHFIDFYNQSGIKGNPKWEFQRL
jgi:hypothetical protein